MSRGKNRFYVDIQSTQNAVTGSGNIVTVTYPDGAKEMFLVDYGLFQGSDEQEQRNQSIPFDAKKLRAIIVTHAHADHIARIPQLYRDGAYCRTFLSKDTFKVSETMLYNATSIINSAQNKKTLYNFTDLGNALKNFRACDYGDTINITDRISFKLINNAHIAGAALVYVQITYPGEQDINILFSGDYKKEDIFMEPTIIPPDILHTPLTMILESTYGSRTKKQEESGKFRNEVSLLAKKGKNILIPAFAFGRSQRVLYELKQMQDENMLDTSIPIFLDGGLAINITSKWSSLETVKMTNADFLPRNFRYVSESEDRRYLMNSSQQKIIVTTSGMCNFGPAREYIPYYLVRNNAAIYITGYSAEGTTSRKILDSEDGEVVNILGMLLKKNAMTFSTSEFSSHAHQGELIDFVSEFDKINFLILNHGEEDGKEALGKKICTDCNNVKQIGIMDGLTDFRIGPYGLIKTLRM